MRSVDFASTNAFRVHLQVLQKWMQQQYSASMRKHKLKRKQEHDDQLLHSPWHRAAYKNIRNDFSPPVVALQDDQGCYVTQPEQMDRLLQRKWQHVYQGNMFNHVQGVAAYLAKYFVYLFRSSIFTLDDLDPFHLEQICHDYPPSSPGLDCWHPVDFKLFPHEAFIWLARLLDLVEFGAPWPSATLHAKAVLLSKDRLKPYSPLDYRILMVMPAVYRIWAKARL
eukprot:5096348-Karenia_brevis.AAC.1